MAFFICIKKTSFGYSLQKYFHNFLDVIFYVGYMFVMFNDEDVKQLAAEIYGGKWGERTFDVSRIDMAHFEAIFDCAFFDDGNIRRVVNAAYAEELLSEDAPFEEVCRAYADDPDLLPKVLVSQLDRLNIHFLLADLKVSSNEIFQSGCEVRDVRHSMRRFNGMTLKLAAQKGYFLQEQKLEKEYGPYLLFNPSTYAPD